MTNAKPVAAGLNKLRPRPPNGNFATKLATPHATIGNHYGTTGDITKPMIPPVTAAVPSVRGARFICNA